MQAVRERLLASELAPVYGCPGCEDGGTFAFSLAGPAGGGVEHRYDLMLVERLAEVGPETEPPVYEGPRIPSALVDAHKVFKALSDAVAWCRSNELISVIDPCTPSEP